MHTINNPDADLSALYESQEEEYGEQEYNYIWFYFVFEKKEGNVFRHLKGRGRKKGYGECNISYNITGELGIKSLLQVL